MITRIYADNFRCLGNFEFRPKQLNLLLGENGSGKTSLFEVLLRIRLLVVAGSSAASLFAYTKTIWDRRTTQSFEIEVEGPEGTFSYRLEIQHPLSPAPEEPIIKGEFLTLRGKPLFRYSDGQVQLFDEDHEPDPRSPSNRSRAFCRISRRRTRNFSGSRASSPGSTSFS